jgi:hypothetical protein
LLQLVLAHHPQGAQSNADEIVRMPRHECGIGESRVWIPSVCYGYFEKCISLVFLSPQFEKCMVQATKSTSFVYFASRNANFAVV